MSKTRGDCKMAKGGSIYEKQMVGMKPSSTPRHINYEANMRGERSKSGYAEGGPVHRERLGMVQKMPAIKKNHMV
jgi:hypothetical protein